MTDNETRTGTNDEQADGSSPRQRAIEAYEGARERVSGTLGEAPLIALAGGIAAGALIAALLPRTEAETRAIRPTARRVRRTARGCLSRQPAIPARQRLDELGINRAKGEETIRSLLEGVTDAAKASGQAALDAARKG